MIDIFPVVKYNEFKRILGNDNFSKLTSAYKNGFTSLLDTTWDIYSNPKLNGSAHLITREQVESTARLLFSVLEWYKQKQVYRFDEDLWNTISEVDDVNINSIIFNSLPFNCFYIEHPIHSFSGAIFIKIENRIQICFVGDKNNYSSYLDFVLNEETTINTMFNQNTTDEITNNPWFTQAIKSILSAALYLCSEKPDISTYKQDIPETTKNRTKRQSKSKTSNNSIKINTTGLKIGKVIREFNLQKKKYTTIQNHNGKHTPKTPHIRKAHWHSFWTGNKENRKLIIKFIPATFVGGNSESNITVREIKS